MIVKTNNVNMYYGSKCALKDVSIEFEPGIYGMLGPNGAGKSTLMNILTGNLICTSGSVTCDGMDIVALGSTYRARIGYMPQQQELYPFFTCFQFMEYMAALKGISRKNLKSYIEELAEMVNLTEKLFSKIGSLSGGMKQRLLLAQAFMGEPELVILDEPTAGLDPKERIRVRNMIAKFALNRTIIVATHVVPDVEFISRKIIMLRQGNVIEMDSPENLILSMEGHVFEICTDTDNLDKIQSSYKVTNIYQSGSSIYVRILSDELPKEENYKSVRPMLEDKYLALFDDERSGEIYA